MVVQCPVKALRGSGLLKKQSKNEKADITVDLDSQTMTAIVHYLEHIRSNPPAEILKPVPDDFRTAVGAWDDDFLNKLAPDPSRLCRLLLQAEYLKIPTLMELVMAKLALLLRWKSPQETAPMFDQKQQPQHQQLQHYKPEQEHKKSPPRFCLD